MNLSSSTRTRQCSASIVVSRVSSAILGSVMLTMALTACIGPIKPTPTQQSQEATPPPIETAEAPKPVELAPSDAPPSVSNAPALPLPPIGLGQPIEPQAKQELPVVEAKPVLVTTSRESYVVPNATSGTRTDTPIMETQLNVQVISQQVLKDQQVIQLDQALKNVSGVPTTTSAAGGNEDFVFLRGFAISTLFRNGFRMDPAIFPPSGQQFANVESIEVLKGPSAILYGRVEPGGMVNVITKSPLATPYYSLTQQFGSYNLYRTSLDATGPLTNDETLQYRFNMSYKNSGSFRDLISNESIFLAPIVRWFLA